MDYYVEGELKMGRGYIKDMSIKLINVLINEISVIFDKSKVGCKLNFWNKKESFTWKSKWKKKIN